LSQHPFIHLRVHSEFSLVDGIIRVKPLVDKVTELGMPAVALTDQSNLCALVKFYQAAINAGIKPLFGADIWLQGEQNQQTPYPLRALLLVQNQTGYHNLTQLISLAYTQGQTTDKPLVSYDWLAQYNEGLLALSGGSQGDIGQALLMADQATAEQRLAWWQQHFANRYYLELQRTGRSGEEDYLHQVITLAERFNCPVVATNEVCFLTKDDFIAHEARVCINQSHILEDSSRPRHYSEQQYLRTSAEMAELFADIPEALTNSWEIAKRCNLQLSLGQCYLPNYPVPANLTLEQFFCRQARQGLEQRLAKLFDQQQLTADELEKQRSQYQQRLQSELDIILQMGYAGYFLIVMDFIRWAKDHDIPVGPGRGSGAGSLVAYALAITDLDPIGYDLLFERFLNPERVSMPDFDIDFCMEGRDRVIDYVAETYGRDAVSQIITFGTMAAKAVVRDVARVLGKPYGFADKLSKMIPFELGMTLKKAMEQEQPLQAWYKESEEVRDVWDLSLKLEGITRNAGKHAGGVVIAPSKLTDFSPLYCDNQSQNLVTQFDKDDIEQVGLVKFDFLGLRTLTIINSAVETVNRKRQQQQQPLLDINSIDLTDQQTFELLQTAQTTAVFQLESRGMKELIKRLKPSSFEDIIALVALFRPGPLQSGMVDDFINRKHGRAAVEYPHPDLAPILANTYGVILYQEQVMQIAQVLAGYSLGAADLLRRAMGKKKPAEMAKQRAIFIKGALANNIEEALATYIFDLMEKFAGYGFNKSHSAAYALLSYQTAWLKCHYPAEFMAAVLSADMDNTDKVVALIEDCRQQRLELRLPSVNYSDHAFTVDSEGRIVYGLGAIKGVGGGPVKTMSEARQAGPFTDLFDFCQRVDLKQVNKRTFEALISAGALDELGPSRSILMASLEQAIKVAEQSLTREASGMLDLFADEPVVQVEQDIYGAFRQLAEWSEQERLAGEKATLGLYLTGHPVSQYTEELTHITSAPIKNIQPSTSGNHSTVAGLVIALRMMKNKQGDKMAFATLEDTTGRIELAVFAEAFNQYQDLLKKDNIIVAQGEVSVDDYSGQLKMVVRNLANLDQARAAKAKALAIRLEHDKLADDFIDKLKVSLTACKQGHCPVRVCYSNSQVQVNLTLADDWLVTPEAQLLAELKQHFGDKQVSVIYH
jgi:DNA polymerase-3 subunit alpha